MDVRDLAARVLRKALDAHPDHAEVYCVSASSISAEAKGGQMDALEASDDHGVGLRVMRGEKTGFAFSSSGDDEAVMRLVKEAMASAENTEPDPAGCLPSRPDGYPDVFTDDASLREIPKEQVMDWAVAMEKAALMRDPRVRAVRKASVTVAHAHKCILSSDGIDLCTPYSLVSAGVMVMAEEDGDSQSGWEFDFSRTANGIDVAAIGGAAADRALRLLGAKSVASGFVPVILENSVSADFLGVLASAFCADTVQKGKSLFAGKAGEAIASPVVDMIDDGLLPGGIASAPADDEGVPRERRALVESGVLQGFLHNSYTAKKDGVVSTGNAVRGGFKSTPGVGVSNLFLAPGTASLDELLDAREGLYVTEAMGIHTANPVSGDFSIGVSGLWIEKGRAVHPVRGVVIAGNLVALMKQVEMVGSDLRFFGRVGAPTVRVRGLSISGK